jgi:peptidoglycan/xylan/chitin deacetylase (PgdA/CDA1 family)
MVTDGDARLGAARIAVSFVLNYEEGGERNVLDGDAHAENYLVPEIAGLPPIAGCSRIVEDLFEYGSRAGFWRVLRLFEERGLRFTSWAVGLALKRNPDAGRAMAEAGHDVASHSWRWIDYSGMPEDESATTSARLWPRSVTFAASRRSGGTPAATAQTRGG